ncbi:MAG: CPBP family intramembrane metalloprotease [Bacteroidia bacterium]|nr:CPBP family intramembrane metalloprotease [Bacteroidia bacterium]
MLKLGQLLQENRIAKLLELVLVFFLAAVFIYFFMDRSNENQLLNMGILWLANVFMLLWVWAGLKLRGEDCSSLGLSFKLPTPKEALKNVGLSLVVFVLAMLGFVLGSIVMANITGIPEPSDMSAYDYLKDNIGLLILSLLGIYMVSSFGEEVVYRGFLITRITELVGNTKWGRVVAVLISAIIFGFAHYGWGPMGIVQTFFMGLALGICYLWLKKKLWILVLAHAYMDTILILQLFMAGS